MRVPSTGLTPDERRFVREGYELAERLLRDYRDPPLGILPTIGRVLASGHRQIGQLFRAIVRD